MISGDSVTSMFELTLAVVLHGDEPFDDRVGWDSRVRFRLGDKCNEDEDVDVIYSAIIYQFNVSIANKLHVRNRKCQLRCEFNIH